MYKLLGKKEQGTRGQRKNEGGRAEWRPVVVAVRRQQMELAGSLVGPSREIEVAFLRAY